jgi:hypothetical protein
MAAVTDSTMRDDALAGAERPAPKLAARVSGGRADMGGEKLFRSIVYTIF